MEAITREEKIMSGENLTPITRKEMFLAKAAGVNIQTPTPITREEMFLSKISSELPIKIATEAEMTALLTSGEVGGVYKYTGTTGTYENGAFYLLEEEAETEDELAGTWKFNNTLTVPNFTECYVDFESAGIPFRIITYEYNDKDGGYTLNYISNSSNSTVYSFTDNDFVNVTDYTTISISSKLSEVTNGSTLLTWLKSNATKQ